MHFLFKVGNAPRYLASTDIINKYFHISGGLTALRLFMESEHCEENIEFWMVCEEFRKIRSRSKLKSRAKTIYEEFIREDSPKEVRFSRCQQSWYFVFIKPCHTVSSLSLFLSRSTWTSTQRSPSTRAFWSQHSPVSKLPRTEFTSWWSTTRTLGSWTLNSTKSSAELLQESDNVCSRCISTDGRSVLECCASSVSCSM